MTELFNIKKYSAYVEVYVDMLNY